MQLNFDLQLSSVIKSLQNTVLPAIDPANGLAMEQCRIALGVLTLLQAQLPLAFRFSCDELRRSLTLTQALAALCTSAESGDLKISLTAQSHAAQDVLHRAQAEPREVAEAARALRAANSEAITKLATDSRVSDQAAQAVLDSAKEQLLRDRAWVLTQGWETQPELLPPLMELLAPIEISR